MSELSELMALARAAEDDDELTRLIKSDPVAAHDVIADWRDDLQKQIVALNSAFRAIGRDLALGTITEHEARKRRYEMNVQRGKVKGVQRVVKRLEQQALRLRGEQRRAMTEPEFKSALGARVLPLIGIEKQDLKETQVARALARREHEYARIRAHADLTEMERLKFRKAILDHHAASTALDLDPEPHDLELWAIVGKGADDERQ
jgi:hypothetical protein